MGLTVHLHPPPRMTLRRTALPALVAALAAAPAAAQRPDTLPTPAPIDVPAPEPAQLDLAGAACQGVARYLNVRANTGAQLTPDGSAVVFTATTTGLPQLWSAPVRAEGPAAPRQLTFGGRVQFADVSPDGRWVAYGTDRDGDERTRFFLLSPDGTRERALTPADGHFRLWGGWSPRGDHVAWSSAERNGRDFDLWIQALDADGAPRRAPRMVLEGAGTAYVEAWRPDGGALVLGRGRGEADNDLFLLDIASGRVDTLFVPRAMSSYVWVDWTPDGTAFYLATNHEREWSGLARYDVASRRLEWVFEPRRDVEAVTLSRDGRWLAYAVNEDGWSRVVVRELAGGRESTPDVPAGVLTGFGWADRAPRLLVGMSGPALPGDAWVYDPATREARRVTEGSLAGLDSAAFVPPEPVTIRADDGEAVHGLLYRPRRADGRRAPVVMMLHGGPTSQARPRFDGVKQYLLARGYAILDLNFRGSTGYGQRFTQLDNGRRRPDVLRDLRAAVEHLRTLDGVDGTRVAAMGGSYGGYLTLAAVAQLPEHFAAGVDIVGVANWVSALEETSPQLKNSDRIEYGDIDDPADRAFFAAISPLTYADRIRSPLLVVHGANDPRVPVAEADQIVRAVRARGGDVEYLRFPDEGHGIAQLRNRVTAYQRIARFLDRVLGGGTAACAERPAPAP